MYFHFFDYLLLTYKKKQNKKNVCYFSNDNILLNISWIFSLTSLASRIISDDYNVVKQKYRNLNFKYDECLCINLGYVIRVIFRWMDVIGRIGILSLTWVALNGYFTAVLIALDLFIAFIFTFKTKELCFFECVYVFWIFVVKNLNACFLCFFVWEKNVCFFCFNFNQKNEKLKSDLYLKALLVLPFPKNKYWYYRWLLNLIILIAMTVIINVPFNDSLKDRYYLVFNYNFGIFIYAITWFAAILCPFTFKLIEFEKFAIKGEERTYHSLWQMNAFADVRECIEYYIFKEPKKEVRHQKTCVLLIRIHRS